MAMPAYRIQYSKKGPARYVAHLDLIRVFERAARRAGLPLAFTSGFSPHPKISFAVPLAVGMDSEAEYVDLELSDPLLPLEVAKKLSASLPAGIAIGEVRAAPEDRPALMTMVDRAIYRVESRLSGSLTNRELESAVGDFLAQPEVFVERKTKSGQRKEYDIRPGIFAMSGTVKDDIIFLEMELKAGSSGNIRVNEVMTALQKRFPFLLKDNVFAVSRKGLKFKTTMV
ncbi:MAG: DUF2344 domain-containing protein [Peptococcaceae bacterium]|nr:MAG: DUF2344 domain-containing protein [Peptococcaceae bacterium]